MTEGSVGIHVRDYGISLTDQVIFKTVTLSPYFSCNKEVTTETNYYEQQIQHTPVWQNFSLNNNIINY